MDKLETILSINQDYIFYGLLFTLFVLEAIRYRTASFRQKIKHFIHNFPFQLIILMIGFIVVFMTTKTFEWIETYQLGLLNQITVPFWLKIIIGVFLIDLADYWLHRMDHKIPLLWRQHRVHHSDTQMDVSTALRVFPTDLIYFVGGECIIALIFGLDMLSMSIFLFLLLIFMFLHHTSLTYPLWVDSMLGWLVVMPNYHKVHHEQDQHYTDSNYGTLFIIWDRIFGTFKKKSVAEINYGLKEFENPEKQTFWYQIMSPFINIKRT